MPYLERIADSYYICKKVKEDGKWKHQYLRRLGKISEGEAEQKLREFLVSYSKMRERIDAKMGSLNDFKKIGGVPYDVWDFPERGEGGSKEFHGNTSPKVVRQLLIMLTKAGEHVVDPMAGSGTTIDVCNTLRRQCTAFDLYPYNSNIIQHDATEPWPNDNSANFVFIHPPYWNLVRYGNKQNDLSATPTLGDYITLLRKVFKHAYNALISGGWIAVQQGDLVQDGSYYPLCTETFMALKEIGFTPHHEIIKVAHGEVSRKKSGMLVAEYVWQEQWKISHDRILIFKKRG